MPTYIEVQEGCIDEFAMHLTLKEGDFFEMGNLQEAFECAVFALMHAEGKIYANHS